MLSTLVSNLNFYCKNVKQQVEDLEYVPVRARERERERERGGQRQRQRQRQTVR